jgi:transposase
MSQRYLTDLTDTEWTVLTPFIPAAKPGGRPRTTDMREVVNALVYMLRGGCQWRLLPTDFPPHQTVYHLCPDLAPDRRLGTDARHPARGSTRGLGW